MRKFPALLALLILAACQAPPQRPVFPDLHFTGEPPIRLDVATIEVRQDYREPYKPPNVEQFFPVTPGHAAQNWAHDRLAAAGRSNRAVFVVRTASAVEIPLPKSEGIKGAFTTEPTQRYDLRLEATLQILDERGVAVRTANAQAVRSQSLLEGITPNEREQAWYDMTKALLADFDRQITGDIQGNFGLYYVR